MHKMKKTLTILVAITIYLTACWFIGQRLHPDAEAQNNQAAAQGTTDGTSIDLSAVIYEGSAVTEDNPWKTTAGTIDLEDRGKSIFLTPNTTALLSNVSEMNEIAFSYEIHPWVKESSDGAGLVIWLMDAQNNIIHEEEIVISASDDMKEFKIDLTQYKGVTKIKFLCNNGTNENDSGDWVVLSGM